MNPTGTIREGTNDDLPAVRGLLMRDVHYRGSDVHLLTTLSPGRRLIVLENAARDLVAAALFAIHDGRGQLLLLVVSPDRDDPHEIEARMFGVVEAICEACGSTTVDMIGQRALH